MEEGTGKRSAVIFIDFDCPSTYDSLCLHPLLAARARKHTEKLDRDVKKKAERLHHIATVCIILVFLEGEDLYVSVWLMLGCIFI